MKNQVWYIIVIFLLSFQFTHAAYGKEKENSLADSLFSRAKEFQEKALYDSAQVLYLKAAESYIKTNNRQGYIKGSYFAAYILTLQGEYQKAQTRFFRILKIAKGRYKEKTLNIANIYFFIGNNYDEMGKYEQALDYYNKSLNIKRKLLPEDDRDIGLILNMMGIACKRLGHFDKAIDFYLKALSIFREKNNNILDLAMVYSNIGTIYQEKGYYRDALPYHLKALAINTHILGKDHPDLAINYNNLALLYENDNDLEKANEYYKKTLSLDIKTLGAHHKYVADDYYNIGANFIRMEKYEKALDYLAKSRKIVKKVFGEKSEYMADIYNNEGICHYKQGNNKKALALFVKSISVLNGLSDNLENKKADTYFNQADVFFALGQNEQAKRMYHEGVRLMIKSVGQYGPDVAKYYIGLARVYIREKKYDRALTYSHKAINTLFYKEHKRKAPMHYLTESMSDKMMARSLELRGDAFHGLYIREGKHSLLDTALYSWEKALNVLEKSQETISRAESKLHLGRQISLLLEKIIDKTYESHEQLKSPLTVGELYIHSEKKRARVLHQALMSLKARAFAGVHPETLESLRENRKAKSYYVSLLARLEEASNRDGQRERDKLQNQLFMINSRIDSLENLIAQKYPEYKRLTNIQEIAGVHEIQHLLSDSTLLLEYALTREYLYIFAVRRDSIALTVKPAGSVLRKQIKDFIISIRKYDRDKYQKLSRELYYGLVRPVAGSLKDISRLLIIPDEELSMLPFEALRNGSGNYLIEKYAVSYGFSATLWAARKKKGSALTGAGFLGIAPGFETKNSPSAFLSALSRVFRSADSTLWRDITVNGKTFQSLPHSKEEVNGIASMFRKQKYNAEVFTGAAATEGNLRRKASGKAFIHIATHGIMDNRHPRLSALFFYPPDSVNMEDDGVLYAGEAYNLQMNPDLLVLSACESGLGMLAKGEGLLSITRGFFYAGARNIVVSLWKVADKSTSGLMQSFYKYVLQGQSYAGALRRAKLDMLKNPATHFPRDWAGFVLIGQ